MGEPRSSGGHPSLPYAEGCRLPHLRRRVVGPAESLTADVESAVLVLRLGIAVNAIRAAQRFFLASRDAPGPAGERDRLWSFLIALGFLQEARRMLNGDYRRIEKL